MQANLQWTRRDVDADEAAECRASIPRAGPTWRSCVCRASNRKVVRQRYSRFLSRSSSGSSSPPDCPSTPLNSNASASPSRSASLVRPTQPRVFELFDVGQIAQALEPEFRQKPRRGDIGIGGAGGRAARPGRDEPRPAQQGDRVSRNLSAQKLRQLPAGDRLKIRDRHQDDSIGLADNSVFFLRSPSAARIETPNPSFVRKLPAPGDGAIS